MRMREREDIYLVCVFVWVVVVGEFEWMTSLFRYHRCACLYRYVRTRRKYCALRLFTPLYFHTGAFGLVAR